MPKSKIIKDIVNGTAEIETSLNRLYLLATDIKDETIMEWAEKELQGYSQDEDIPDYRKIRSLVFRFSGISGNFQVKNIALQPELLGTNIIDMVSKIDVRDSVSTIMHFAENKNDLERDLGFLVGEVFKNSHGTIKATTISQIITPSMYNEIVSCIKQKIIREFIQLEKEYGNLDELEIQSDEDPENIAFWNNINVEIKKQTKELYTKSFYESAADRSVKMVETHMRQLFRKLKPNTTEPRNIGEIINALLSENGAFHYCDTTNPDGKNFCRGFVQLTQGFFTAYRNPHAHNIHDMSKREAFEIISLSSMIMEVLNQDIDNNNI